MYTWVITRWAGMKGAGGGVGMADAWPTGEPSGPKPGGGPRAGEAEAARGCAGAVEGEEAEAAHGCAATKGSARGSVGSSKGDEEDGTSRGGVERH